MAGRLSDVSAPKRWAVAQHVWSSASGGADSKYLSFSVDDRIEIVESREEGGWWAGRLNGKLGWFPSSFCTITEEVMAAPVLIDLTEDEEPAAPPPAASRAAAPAPAPALAALTPPAAPAHSQATVALRQPGGAGAVTRSQALSQEAHAAVPSASVSSRAVQLPSPQHVHNDPLSSAASLSGRGQPNRPDADRSQPTTGLLSPSSSTSAPARSSAAVTLPPPPPPASRGPAILGDLLGLGLDTGSSSPLPAPALSPNTPSFGDFGLAQPPPPPPPPDDEDDPFGSFSSFQSDRGANRASTSSDWMPSPPGPSQSGAGTLPPRPPALNGTMAGGHGSSHSGHESPTPVLLESPPPVSPPQVSSPQLPASPARATTVPATRSDGALDRELRSFPKRAAIPPSLDGGGAYQLPNK